MLQTFENMVKLTDNDFLLTSSSLEPTTGAVYHLDPSGIPVVKYFVNNVSKVSVSFSIINFYYP